jgi:hypothetical protein
MEREEREDCPDVVTTEEMIVSSTISVMSAMQAYMESLLERGISLHNRDNSDVRAVFMELFDQFHTLIGSEKRYTNQFTRVSDLECTCGSNEFEEIETSIVVEEPFVTMRLMCLECGKGWRLDLVPCEGMYEDEESDDDEYEEVEDDDEETDDDEEFNIVIPPDPVTPTEQEKKENSNG